MMELDGICWKWKEFMEKIGIKWKSKEIERNYGKINEKWLKMERIR